MPKSVLVADDSITMRKAIGMVFSTEDFSVTMVDNGVDAINKARELRPDLVIADCVMPGKTGYEVAHAIRSDPSTSHTPVMLLAGTFEAFDENRARASGASAHIVKPFDSQSFMDRVRALVGMAPGSGPITTVSPVSTGAAPMNRPAAASPPTGIPMGTQPGTMARPPTGPGQAMPRPPGPPGGIPTGTQPGMRAPGMPPGPGMPQGPGMPRPPGPPGGIPAGTQPGMRPPGMPGAPGMHPGMARPPGPPGGMPPGTQPGMRPPGMPGHPGMPPQGMNPGLPRPPGGAPLPGNPMQARRDPFGLGAPPPGGPMQGRPMAPQHQQPPQQRHETLSLDDKPADGGEAALRAALSAASKDVIEKIAWEVVPQLAETIIREELDRLIKEREAKGLA